MGSTGVIEAVDACRGVTVPRKYMVKIIKCQQSVSLSSVNNAAVLLTFSRGVRQGRHISGIFKGSLPFRGSGEKLLMKGFRPAVYRFQFPAGRTSETGYACRLCC